MRRKSAVSRPKRGPTSGSARNCRGDYSFRCYIHMITWASETEFGCSVAYKRTTALADGQTAAKGTRARPHPVGMQSRLGRGPVPAGLPTPRLIPQSRLDEAATLLSPRRTR